MFEATERPRVFGQPLGADFPSSVVKGLRARLADSPPEAMARVTLIVNTTRMRRRISSLLMEDGAGFLPRILLLSDVEKLAKCQFAPAKDPLRKRLELAQLIAPLLRDRPELAPRSSIFALSDSLARLLDEMQGEGVSADDIANLDVSDESGHWQNAKALISIAHSYVSSIEDGMDSEARQLAIVDALIDQWLQSPPEHPVILAGSTGSRGTTLKLMEAVARLPQGAIILPGFDSDLPANIWSQMTSELQYEDHPQFRFARILQGLELDPLKVEPWFEETSGAAPRNKVLSLALRPAPVTDAWLNEGSSLPDLPDALSDVTLLEAPTQRVEAIAIAMRLRKAAEDGVTAALITPDRMLGRQVAAALERWDIEPDDSGGAPLHLSAPGRFLRQTAELFLRPLDAEMLLALLKHPLTQSGDLREIHGLYTQRLELLLRRDSAPLPDAAHLTAMVEKLVVDRVDAEQMRDWGRWIAKNFCAAEIPGPRSLTELIELHVTLSERIASGDDGSGELWDKAAGQAALKAISALKENAQHGGEFSASEYLHLLTSVLSQEEVRDRDAPHPNIMFWGTMEARVQGADLVILGSLNEDVWPSAISADPWLNRRMRHAAGLLLPDRQVGLAAHDFQQAMAAPEVWITRSVRSDDAETVPSRWVNRLTNLIDGVPEKHGPDALKQMRVRGEQWLKYVAALETVEPTPAATRAAPIPPVSARPRDFSVTEIKTLIRDPYAIYAKHCLKLRELDPLVQEPDAPIRGIVIHQIMEDFVSEAQGNPAHLTTETLMRTVDSVLNDMVPWPTARVLWRSRLERIADWIVSHEIQRLAKGAPAKIEGAGRLALSEIGGSIRARADRIDLTDTGEAILYDYKSGSPPSAAQQKQFDKQLLIEAAMLEEGAFADLGPRRVEDAVYIGLGSSPKEVGAPLNEERPADTLKHLISLIRDYLEPDQHFPSRRMLHQERFSGPYDHLARHGEWDDEDQPHPEDLS